MEHNYARQRDNHSLKPHNDPAAAHSSKQNPYKRVPSQSEIKLGVRNESNPASPESLQGYGAAIRRSKNQRGRENQEDELDELLNLQPQNSEKQVYARKALLDEDYPSYQKRKLDQNEDLIARLKESLN